MNSRDTNILVYALNQDPYRRLFDAVLASTLVANGVRRFYTRNTRDFEKLGFQEVVNPIDGKTESS